MTISSRLIAPSRCADAALLLRLGLDPRVKVRDLKERVGCRGYGARARE
jgi:hypothetical protein